MDPTEMSAIDAMTSALVALGLKAGESAASEIGTDAWHKTKQLWNQIKSMLGLSPAIEPNVTASSIKSALEQRPDLHAQLRQLIPQSYFQTTSPIARTMIGEKNVAAQQINVSGNFNM
jgi:hypothetical protein